MEEYQDRSLGGKVFQQIRADIINGRYRENDELRENTIGKELGVSRTPVREALRQLELEGLVTIIPNRGAYVTGISHKDIRDIYMIRSRLEGLCAGWAARLRTEEELEKLEETVYLSKFHAQKEHYEQVFELDSRFHEILYEASHSRMLAHTLSDFHQYVQKARKMSITSRSRSRKSNEEHQAILEAIRSTTVHPTAEWVYQAVKPQYPDLSLGTVYRNIARFKEEGLIHAIGVVNGQERYDGDIRPHNHFVCSQCGSVMDLSEKYLSQEIHQLLSEKYDMLVLSHELIFHGVCQKCLYQKPVSDQRGA